MEGLHSGVVGQNRLLFELEVLEDVWLQGLLGFFGRHAMVSVSYSEGQTADVRFLKNLRAPRARARTTA